MMSKTRRTKLQDLDPEKVHAFFRELTGGDLKGWRTRATLAGCSTRRRERGFCPDSVILTIIGDSGQTGVSPRIIDFAIRQGWQPKVETAFPAEVGGDRACGFLLASESVRELANVLMAAKAFAPGDCTCTTFCGGLLLACLEEVIWTCKSGKVFMVFAPSKVT